MLSIGKINGADGKTGRYYTDAVASGSEDYYAGEGEANGRWVGTGAGIFELEGEVDGGQFHHMLNGIDPTTGAPVRIAPRDSESGELRAGVVRGFDLTFSAPKSVSVLYAAGDERVAAAVRDALDHATAEALRWLEERACVVRRGSGGVIEQRGAGFVGAAFRHRTSRAGDPQLHTHVVISNMAQGPDGRWTALHASHIYAHSRTAGFVFQAVMRDELTRRLGVRWRESPTPGVFEIAGVPFELMRELSKRRVEIEQAMVEHGATSAAAAQVATLETRPAKDHQLDHAPGLHERWRALAAEHGFGLDEVNAILGLARAVKLDESARARIVEQMLGPNGLTVDESVFSNQKVVRAWAQAAIDGATVAQLDQLTTALLQHPDVVAIPHEGTLDAVGEAGQEPAALTLWNIGSEGEGITDPVGEVFRGTERFTTRELLGIERDLLARAEAGRGVGAGICRERTGEEILADAPTASAEQRAMVRALTRRGDRLAVVRAPAGAGKTWTLNLARQAWQADGYTVLGAALSRRAASELGEQAQLDYATSIARLLVDVERESGLPDRAVLLVDEAAMVGTRKLHQLLGIVERAGGSLVLIGDDHQVPEIEAGGAFRALAERLETIELTDNFRQQDPLERARVQALRHGAAETYLHTGMRSGQIVLGADAEQTRHLLLMDWLRDRQISTPGEAIMLARANADVQWLNDAARALLKQQGKLDGPELSVAGRSFAVGDLVIGRRNLPGNVIHNGTRAEVIALDHERQAVTVRTPGERSREIKLNAAYLQGRHLHHAYALTVNLAQGMSVDRVCALGGEGTYARELIYSALTRHRIEAHYYLTAPDPLRLGIAEDRDPLGPIVNTLGPRAAKRLALDTPADDLLQQHVPTVELRARRDVLHELLHTYPSQAAQQQEWHRSRLTAAEHHLADARERIERLTAQLEIADRDERPTVEHALSREQSTLAAWEREHRQHHDALAEIPDRLDPELWLRRNALAVKELASVEHALDQREQVEVRSAIATALISPDEQLHAQIGGRPFDRSGQLAWDHAVRAITTYRYYEPPEPASTADGSVLGPEPADHDHQLRWREARRALEAQQRGLNYDGPEFSL